MRQTGEEGRLRMMTRYFFSSSLGRRWEPTNPVAPVRRMVLTMLVEDIIEDESFRIR